MLKGFASLLFEQNCSLCQRSTRNSLCQYCEKQLKSCQLKDSCQFWQGDLPLFAWGNYQGKLKQAIATLKYDKHVEIGELMGYWLAEAWLNSSLSDRGKQLTVIPIPLHEKRRQERGFNQAELIAKGFCRLTKYRLQTSILKRVRETQAMFNLSSLERKNNISNAFILSSDLQHKHLKSQILLIDDIYTTGTTAKEAAKVLRQENIFVVGVSAIAMANV
jgi:ComF family protein